MNLLDQADADLREGRVSEAVLALRAHVAEHPTDAVAIERLAFACHRLGDLPAAAEAFKSLCSIQPSSASAASNFAAVLGQMQRYDEALRHFDRAIALDASFVDARFNRAQILEMRGRTSDAISDFRHVVEANPDHKLAWYRLGHLLINRVDAKRASWRSTAPSRSTPTTLRRGGRERCRRCRKRTTLVKRPKPSTKNSLTDWRRLTAGSPKVATHWDIGRSAISSRTTSSITTATTARSCRATAICARA